MERWELPMLYCPFPSTVNLFSDTVGVESIDWAVRHGLIVEPLQRRRLEAARVGWLVGRTNPTAPQKPLQLLSDWCTWLFLQDDRFDEHRIGKNPDAVAAHYVRSFDVLSGAPLSPRDPPVVRVLEDLRARFMELARKGWLKRFLHAVENSFEASVWEACNRQRGAVPALEAYLYYRPYTGGVHTLVETTDLTENPGLPLTVYDHPYLRQMVQCAVNVICWANDIVSLSKELKQGDVHNLVMVLQQTHALSLQEAVYRAAVLHNDEVCRFMDLEAAMPDFGVHDPPVRRYVSLQKAWMKGNLEWSYMSERYF